MYPDNCRYTNTHEWARQDGELITVGITEYAVKELTDLVFIELPAVGTEVKRGEPFGEIESVKAVADLKSPVDGEVAEINSELPDNLEILNEDPYDKGWMIKVKPSSDDPLEGLWTFAEYEKKSGAD